MDINKDFVIESRYLPYGYFKEITQEGDVYTFSVKAVKSSSEDYWFKLKLAGNDTILIAVKETNWNFIPFTHIPPSDIKYPDKSEVLSYMKGKWYATDGSDKLFVEFFDDHCMLAGKEYTYGRYIVQGGTRQLNLSGEEFGRYVHFIKAGKYSEYTRIEVLGINGWVNLKRSPELPDEPSILFSEVPDNLKETMYGTTAENLTVKLLPTYQVKYNNEVIDLDRLTEHRNKYTLTFTYKGRKHDFSVEEVNSDYSKLNLPGNRFMYLKHKKELPDGLLSDNEFSGSWYACDGSGASLVVGDKKLKTAKGVGPEGAFEKLLFDGGHYKFTRGNKTLAYLRKINGQYIEVATSPNGNFVQYKKETSLPDAAAIELPQSLQENWINKENGQWLLGLIPGKVLYKNDFWNLQEVTYRSGSYLIKAEKTDTVCFKNSDGKKVCKLFPKEVALTLQPEGDNALIAKLENGEEVNCVNSVDLATYKPSFTIPTENEWGYAVVKGYIKDYPEKYQNARFEVSVNDLFLNNQVKYSAKIDENGQFSISVPLVTAQDVYFRHPASFSTSFLIPGDTLLLAIDGKRMKDNSSWLWMGKAAEINRDMSSVLNNKEYRELMGQLWKNEQENLKLEPEAFKEARRLVWKEQKDFYNQQISTATLSPGFKKWLETNFTIDYYNDLMRYCWLRNKGMGILTEHETYFSFADSLDISDKAYWISGNMQNYTHELDMQYGYYRKGNRRAVEANSIDSLFWCKVLSTDPQLSASERKAVKSLVFFTENKKEREMINLWSGLMERNRAGIREEVMKRKLKKVESKELMEILKELDPSISSATLSKLKKHLKRSEKKEKELQPIRLRNVDLHREIFANVSLENRLKSFDGVPFGEFLKQVALTNYLYRSTEGNDEDAMDASWHSIVASNEIEDGVKLHLELVLEKAKEALAKPLPEFASLNDVKEGSAEEFLKNLALKHEGKVLYIDFWAPWCGPCRGEFEHAPAMKEATKEKDVVYVYICGSGGKPAWENCIKKYNLEGDHYYISEGTYSDLQGKFKINGIPRYMIMNKKGQMINQNASRPSNLPATLAELEKYLKE